MSFARLGALAAVSLIALTGAASAQAPEKINFAFQWVAGGDHAPYYYAKKMGMYEKAGLDVSFEHLRGSQAAAQKVGAGAAQLGLADMGVVLVAKGKGAELVGVMNVYANSPQGLYWLKSSGIGGVKDLAGKKIGNPAGDAARQMWPALAKANNIDPNSVTWVNIDANAKLVALKAKAIDATTSFYNLHHVFTRELGSDMGFLAVGARRDLNALRQHGRRLRAVSPRDKKATSRGWFTKVTQKAFADCVANSKPCIDALVEAHGALKFDNELENWNLVMDLMSDPTSQTKVALGWPMDDKRMADDYKLVEDVFLARQAVRYQIGLHQRVPRSVDQDDQADDVAAAGQGRATAPFLLGELRSRDREAAGRIVKRFAASDQHAREAALDREAASDQVIVESALSIEGVDVDSSSDAIEGRPREVDRRFRVVRHQGSDLRCLAPVSTQNEAAHNAAGFGHMRYVGCSGVQTAKNVRAVEPNVRAS